MFIILPVHSTHWDTPTTWVGAQVATKACFLYFGMFPNICQWMSCMFLALPSVIIQTHNTLMLGHREPLLGMGVYWIRPRTHGRINHPYLESGIVHPTGVSLLAEETYLTFTWHRPINWPSILGPILLFKQLIYIRWVHREAPLNQGMTHVPAEQCMAISAFVFRPWIVLILAQLSCNQIHGMNSWVKCPVEYSVSRDIYILRVFFFFLLLKLSL